MTKSQDFVILLAHEIDSNIATLREALKTNRDVKI